MWEFRYYEIDSQGERQRRTAIVGSLAAYPTESAVRKSSEVQALLLRINSEAAQSGAPALTFGAVLARYEKEEMPERHSTSSSYKSNIKMHIRPRHAPRGDEIPGRRGLAEGPFPGAEDKEPHPEPDAHDFSVRQTLGVG